MTTLALALGIALAAPAQDDAPRPMMPSATYDEAAELVPGARLGLWGDGSHVPIAADFFAYNEMMKLMRAKDREGLDQLVESGRVSLAESGTPVLVIEAKDHVDPRAAEVRLKSGPNSGKAVWVPTYYVTRLVPRPRPAPAAPAPDPAEVRAVRLLGIAHDLEPINRAEARRFYRLVVAEHRESPRAADALDRLTALEDAPAPGEAPSAGEATAGRLKQAMALERAAPGEAALRYLEIMAESPDSSEAQDASERLDALALPAPAGVPSVAGRWSESPGVEFTAVQSGGRFAAATVYLHPEAGEVRAVVAGTVNPDGSVVASLRHTRAPKPWARSQRRTGVLRPDGRTIEIEATFKDGREALTWTRIDP